MPAGRLGGVRRVLSSASSPCLRNKGGKELHPATLMRDQGRCTRPLGPSPASSLRRNGNTALQESGETWRPLVSKVKTLAKKENQPHGMDNKEYSLDYKPSLKPVSRQDLGVLSKGLLETSSVTDGFQV